jgi:hypothetical protein
MNRAWNMHRRDGRFIKKNLIRKPDWKRLFGKQGK